MGLGMRKINLDWCTRMGCRYVFRYTTRTKVLVWSTLPVACTCITNRAGSFVRVNRIAVSKRPWPSFSTFRLDQDIHTSIAKCVINHCTHTFTTAVVTADKQGCTLISQFHLNQSMCDFKQNSASVWQKKLENKLLLTYIRYNQMSKKTITKNKGMNTSHWHI